MGNSTNLSSDITAARTSIVTASNAILSNTVHISTAARDFVTIVEKMEHRFKELEEKEWQIAMKHKELDEKMQAVRVQERKMEERETILFQREQRVAEQEKLWGEIKKVMDSSPREAQLTQPNLQQETVTVRSPRERASSVSVVEPHLFKRPEVVPEYHPFKRLVSLDIPNFRLTPTPPEQTIPSSLLIPAGDCFKVWLPNRTFSLIYKSTRDGFGKADFHRICDNKGPTVSLILSDKGHLFGGYAPISWGRTFEGYDTHPDCFLFTISNPHNLPPTQYKLRNGNAYGLRNGQHVSFGWCGDIRIADDNANSTTESCSNFARSFIDTTGKGNTTFTGEHRFKVLEIEVYLVL